MTINQQTDFDKNAKEYFGHVTIKDASSNELGTHLLVALVRGINSDFKQIIGAHVTGSRIPGASMKSYTEKCVTFMENAGFKIVAIGSDMGNNNK